MKKYKLINNIAGWTVFVIAAVVYLMTIEPTTSFWDCGEFITSAYKLEVGHPPGAPFFMLTANVFTQLTSDPANVAVLVNAMSALLSALTILFLFWTITHLTRKLVLKTDQQFLTLSQIVVVIGSGLVGALAYTFSDTFWFSAVEAEVYAYSSMFTALVFWLILKWEDNAHKPHSDKWIVLIAYMMGLSIGVHLLNLLCIPAIVLIYYYKKNDNINWKGTALSLLFSFGLIAVLMYGIIPGFTKVGGWFELMTVNTLGMSYNSGLFIYLIALVGVIIWSIVETMSQNPNMSRVRLTFLLAMALSGVLFIGDSILLWIVLIGGTAAFTFMSKKASAKLINLAMTCLLVILIGYSSFALIPIRSIANPPMDQNSPEDVFSLARYLNREQYGDRPLLYGRTFASEIERKADGTAVTSEKKRYSQVIKSSPDEKDRYVATTSYNYKYTNSMLLPRMHSYSGNPSFSNHLSGYKMWGGIQNENQVPTMLDNIRFLFSYQLNYMYWRYFMWNFSGRQNDVQGDGGITSGNWITGISFIDEHVLGLGPQTDIAPDVADNKARNVYYMLPLLLGIIGIIYQLRLKEKGFQSFLVVFMLFFMTGIAIVLYLNQTPFEPRERDYAYAGSFYAFTIWIGIGVAGIAGFLRNYLNNTALAGGAATLLGILIPIQMAGQNWDDHDRSDRTSARDIGMNYLTSVAPDGIIFCNGDNDTFPLWYAQEVEGFRTDVRVCNLSYLQTEWYVDQMVRDAYDSDPLPISWTRKEYSSDRGTHAYIFTRQQIEGALRNSNISPVQFPAYFNAAAFKDSMSLTDVMENLRDGMEPPSNPFIEKGGVIPSEKLYLDIDTTKVDWAELHAKPTNRMTINLEGKSGVYRQELMILELLSNINKDNWDRPLYYATTVGHDTHLNMTPNFSLNGLTYRVTPGQPLDGGVNTEVMFDNMMNKFKWGGFDNPKVYLDENNRRMFSQMRNLFAMLIDALINKGENEKALQALEKSLTVLPSASMPFGYESIPLAEAYLRLGEMEKGNAIIKEIEDRIILNLDWYNRLSPQKMANNASDILHYNLGVLVRITDLYQIYDHEKYAEHVDDLLSWSEFYYSQGLAQLANTVLKQVTDGSIRGFYTAGDDTMKQAVEEQAMDKSFQLIQQYSPELLQHYNSQQQQ